MLNDTSFLLSDELSVNDIPQHINSFINSDYSHVKETLTNYNYSFYYSKKGLSLVSLNKKRNHLSELIYIDFLAGKNGYRKRKNLTIKQPLAKAVGIKPGLRPSIFDATAGLGGDGFFLAASGCSITLCERSPILAILLKDGLERAKYDENTSQIITDNIILWEGNSTAVLKNLVEKVSTVYMDPMYPHRSKSALNKQEMRVIRNVVGDDLDSDTLLETAIEYAEKRVVVKRPKGAPYVAEQKPSFEVAMKNSRFDIYLT